MKTTRLSVADSLLLLERMKRDNNRILIESCQGLDRNQKRIVEGIYNEFRPLIEATLTAQQIEQLFQTVQQNATAGGDNRTLLGKGVDTAKVVDSTINKVGRWLQDTTPVKAFDQKFEDLKGKVSEKFPNLANNLTALGNWAKENPGKTTAVVGILTALASLAGGPVGGAIAGQILRGSVELMKGEKLSTAIGKGIKTAVYGYISGKALQMIGNYFQQMRIDRIPVDTSEAGLEKVTFGGVSKEIKTSGSWSLEKYGMHGSDSSTATYAIPKQSVYVFPEEAAEITTAMQNVQSGGGSAFFKLSYLADKINTPEYLDKVAAAMNTAQQVKIDNDGLVNFLKQATQAAQAGSQGAIAAAGVASDGKNTSQGQQPVQESVNLTEAQVRELFESTLSAWDSLKSGVAKGWQWAGKKATNLTTKVTADKLMSMWKKAGSPTDSNQIAFMLASNGIPQNVMQQSFDQMNIPLRQGAQQGAQPAAGGNNRPQVDRNTNSVAGQMRRPNQGAARVAGTRTQGGAFTFNPLAGVQQNAPEQPMVGPLSKKQKDKKRNPGNYATPGLRKTGTKPGTIPSKNKAPQAPDWMQLQPDPLELVNESTKSNILRGILKTRA